MVLIGDFLGYFLEKIGDFYFKIRSHWATKAST